MNDKLLSYCINGRHYVGRANPVSLLLKETVEFTPVSIQTSQGPAIIHSAVLIGDMYLEHLKDTICFEVDSKSPFYETYYGLTSGISIQKPSSFKSINKP